MRKSFGSIYSVVCFGLVVGIAVDANAQLDCSFTIHLDDAVSVGSLQFDLDYSGTGGDLYGSGSSVECTDLTGSIATYVDDDAGSLNSAYVSFTGFHGPTGLARCNMSAPTIPSPTDFVVTVTDGSDPFATPLTPLPGASVTNISCGGGSTTTSTTSTTSTTFAGSPFCWVRVSMTTSESLGSLQYNLGYAGANGEFEGSANGVTCENLVPAAISTMADNDVANVGVALISLAGFTGPRDITRCVWLPYGADPVANDYTITVVDASDTLANPVVPMPTLEISDISCFAGPTTTTTSTTTTTLVPYCGDGMIDVDEGCDDAGGNSDTAPDACRTDCTPAGCGDGVTDTDEECDLGLLNDPYGVNGCFDDCTELIICGDANADTNVTASDAQQVLQAGVGLIADCPLERCDASQDGNVTAGDAQRVLSGAVGLLTLNCQQP